jgi:hypothetical protein
MRNRNRKKALKIRGGGGKMRRGIEEISALKKMREERREEGMSKGLDEER